MYFNAKHTNFVHYKTKTCCVKKTHTSHIPWSAIYFCYFLFIFITQYISTEHQVFFFWSCMLTMILHKSRITSFSLSHTEIIYST